MSQVCSLCGKGPMKGKKISRRGLAKKKGGVGKKVTGIMTRRFMPNLQSVKAFVDGKPVRIKVCTVCIKSGRVVKPPKKAKPE